MIETLKQQILEILDEAKQSDYYGIEIAGIAGLLLRSGEETPLVPRAPLPVGDIQQALTAINDAYIVDPHADQMRVVDWILATDEVLSACEWARVDISELDEWELLQGLMRAFPEALLPHKALAARSLRAEAMGSSARSFWESIRDAEPVLEDSDPKANERVVQRVLAEAYK